MNPVAPVTATFRFNDAKLVDNRLPSLEGDDAGVAMLGHHSKKGNGLHSEDPSEVICILTESILVRSIQTDRYSGAAAFRQILLIRT